MPLKIIKKQKVLLFQQNSKGESKIRGLLKYGGNLFELETLSINAALPEILDDTRAYLPQDFNADIVIDFLEHPDLSHDLAIICANKEIPVIASGKKLRIPGVFTPPS